MNIIVCVKQVPESNEIRMDPVTNTIIREGAQAVLNPFDAYALEAALSIKDKVQSKITAISMGIPAAAKMLEETFRIGVDEAILLTDRAFAGSDTLATAYTLAKGIMKINRYDLIICGKQATDGDTAQVGPSLAGSLNIPHITNVSEIYEIEDSFICCLRQTDWGMEKIKLELPAVITVVKDMNVPRLPSIYSIKAAIDKKVKKWGAADINTDNNKIGLKGSPTQVVKSFVPEYKISSEKITGTPEEQAQQLIDRLLG
jgi:electron transfer flavoprotein beta subunit